MPYATVTYRILTGEFDASVINTAFIPLPCCDEDGVEKRLYEARGSAEEPEDIEAMIADIATAMGAFIAEYTGKGRCGSKVCEFISPLNFVWGFRRDFPPPRIYGVVFAPGLLDYAALSLRLKRVPIPGVEAPHTDHRGSARPFRKCVFEFRLNVFVAFRYNRISIFANRFNLSNLATPRKTF